MVVALVSIRKLVNLPHSYCKDSHTPATGSSVSHDLAQYNEKAGKDIDICSAILAHSLTTSLLG